MNSNTRCVRFVRCFRRSTVAVAMIAASVSLCRAEDAAALRLVPFPKEIKLSDGTFSLKRPLVIEAPPGQLPVVAKVLGQEMRRAGLATPKSRALSKNRHLLRMAAPGTAAIDAGEFRKDATDEDYVLRVSPDGVVVEGRGVAGLLHGAQTLVQLLRANRRGDALPCLEIRDWPSLRWRSFQNDMTRGPSAKLETLQRQVELGAMLKMNLFTYYMEYQYAFRRHPDIGPKNGSLKPEELSRLVKFSRPLGVDILGNQQSFGHLDWILKKDRYASLREDHQIITPVKEESYRLLDDLYRDVCPILPFPMFNVCCDETWGLGTGASKELAAKIGVGGVYVQHIRRVHELLARYKKRMMMWGDIILKHPDKLGDIPKDTIMLTWGYGSLPSFEKQIVPFKESGFEFFVCPGVSDWSQILPHFERASINIRNFVRDGARHGAIGMINTEWKDDGESLNAPNWHGYAWGAECAWNSSSTEPADFNRRLGGVLFGEKGDHFGQAISLLSETFKIPGMLTMNNKRFWQPDFPVPSNATGLREQAEKLLALVRPAIEHLEACRRDAAVNAELIDSLILGARRMELIGQRSLDALEVVRLYRAAQINSSKHEANAQLQQAIDLVRGKVEPHAKLGRQFAALWLAENKPYALEWTTKRYDSFVAGYEAVAQQLSHAWEQLKKGQPLPKPEDVKLVALPAPPKKNSK